ncbi:hypothetical protein [Streptomyces echinatus]|uniref:Uncharacterized protein n=1 Tax=Streptomyces echinatus TaxID=67293 RepID=A0A7W9Q2W8_9ACTN|nr:hypothetical protein [Streptomyces echinatus]MBB5932346.1 hypothetical protein [Streptomyces echinatus]
MDAARICIVCSAALYDDEAQTCRPCAERVAANLAALAGPEGLYARLADSLHPGSGSGGPVVSGSRTAPLPVRLEVLNAMTERGPVLGPLEGWVRDWEAYGRATVDETGTLQQRLNHAVGTLRFNLAWAAGQHPAFADFADETWTIVRRCRTATGAEKPPVRVPVACRCGQILRVSLDMDGIECRHCGSEYGHGEMLKLTPTRRAA